jgi:hypothetical protein
LLYWLRSSAARGTPLDEEAFILWHTFAWQSKSRASFKMGIFTLRFTLVLTNF